MGDWVSKEVSFTVWTRPDPLYAAIETNRKAVTTIITRKFG